ncbi:MAG: cation-transporting P-type ATPase, partial [Bacillota bacterium]
MEKSNWHALGQEEVVLKLQTDREKGLEQKEAARRLELVGPNQLVQQKRISPVAIFLTQFKDFMVLVLIAATVISGLLCEYADAITIMAIVIINAILGFIQEFRAEKSMEALKKLIAPEATVKREGETLRIPASQLVPGDLVILDTGD